jgi:branched-chain amino acid transport system substrate-binding protein
MPFRKSPLALIAAGTLAFAVALPAAAQDIRIGGVFSYTGGLGALGPRIRDGARLAVDEVNRAGGVLKGQRLALVDADDQTNPQVAVDVATRLVQVEKVSALIGAMASGSTIPVANSVTIPNGTVQISPSSTAPAISALRDNDFVFRTAVPDGLQGSVIAREARARGVERIAIMAINSAYGNGLMNAIRENFTRLGGTVTSAANFEGDRPSYRAELATAAGSGNPQALVVVGYPANGGNTILRQALENGFFKNFILPDGMRDPTVVREIGAKNLATTWGTAPSSTAEASLQDRFRTAYRAFSKEDPTQAFVAESYDAAMVIALAIQQAGSTDRAAIRDALRRVANGPGERVGPGEFARAKDLIARGVKINYEGASGPVEFDANGDVQGRIGVWTVKDSGEIVTEKTMGAER